MRPRSILEMLVLLGVAGLILEIAGAHPLVGIVAGVAAAIWLLSCIR